MTTINNAALVGMTAVAIALSIATPSAEAQVAQPVKNIVFVHGAFADGSSWAKVNSASPSRRLQRHSGAESSDLIFR